MLLSTICVIMMTLMFLYMMLKSRFARTRRMAFVPLSCAGVELLAAGLLSPLMFPVLTAALILLRVSILVCCVGALRQDAAAARQRARSARAAAGRTPVECTPAAATSRCA